MHEGDSIPGFPSVDVFYYLIQPQLEKLREPAFELIQDIYFDDGGVHGQSKAHPSCRLGSISRPRAPK